MPPKRVVPPATSITVRELPVVSGGHLSEPMILSELQLCSDGHPYVKVHKKAKWLCLMVTGRSVNTRPLSFTTVLDELRKKGNAAEEIAAAASIPLRGLAALGLDDCLDDKQAEKKAGHRKRLLPGAKNWATVSMPVQPGATQMRSLNVLRKSDNEAAWMQLSAENLTWLHDFLRQEILQASAARSTTTEPEDTEPLENKGNIWWCSAASCWRVAAKVSWTTVTQRADVYVPRHPPDTFEQRVIEAKNSAKEKQAELQCSEEPPVRKRGRTKMVPILADDKADEDVVGALEARGETAPDKVDAIGADDEMAADDADACGNDEDDMWLGKASARSQVDPRMGRRWRPGAVRRRSIESRWNMDDKL